MAKSRERRTRIAGQASDTKNVGLAALRASLEEAVGLRAGEWLLRAGAAGARATVAARVRATVTAWVVAAATVATNGHRGLLGAVGTGVA